MVNNHSNKNQKNTIFIKKKPIKDKFSHVNIDRNILKNKRNLNILGKNISFLQQGFKKPNFLKNKSIIFRKNLSLIDLAKKMSIKITTLYTIIKELAIQVTTNQLLDLHTVKLIAKKLGYKIIFYNNNYLEENIMVDRVYKNISKKNRPPIVTIMGHVDHGKTSLLDYLRSSNITSKESGGITQHIGAYHVKTKKGTITFLDTPGHAAFTAMRARGAKITDIVVLVVAADDGVMPQTIEAIQHAKFSKVPILVAINKIDKIDINIEKIKSELMKHSIIPDNEGGENIFVEISAKTGKGINNLLSSILLQAEMLELKARYYGMASGIVIESYIDKGRGPVASVLISEGVIKKGDVVICNTEYGKIKSITNEYKKEIKSAGPSIPIEILGLSGMPIVGDQLFVVSNEKKAKELTFLRKRKLRDTKFSIHKKTNIEELFDYINKKKEFILKIILKADVQGSLEAISEAISILRKKDTININIISSGVGAITESDAALSITSSAMIIGFNVRADIPAKRIIESENIDLRYYSVIYNLISDITLIFSGLLKPKYEPKVLGFAEVRSIFKSPKFGLIAGCIVKNGIIKRTNPIRILRNNIVIYEGELESLRRFKEDVNDVRNGIECGIGIKNYNDIRIKDIIEVFEHVNNN